MSVEFKSWSHTALKDFQGCAKRYHASRVLKLYPFVETDAIKYGKVVHKAFEEYVRDGKPLDDGLVRHAPMLDVLKALPGEKHCEYQMTLDADLQPCGWFDKKAWLRGAADLLIINGTKAHVYDYKTGGAKYPDKTQLELMALLVFEHFPEVQSVKAALLFTEHDVLVKASYERTNQAKMWAKWEGELDILRAAYAADTWHPNPTPLCGWCPVEHCEHNTVKNRR